MMYWEHLTECEAAILGGLAVGLGLCAGVLVCAAVALIRSQRRIARLCDAPPEQPTQPDEPQPPQISDEHRRWIHSLPQEMRQVLMLRYADGCGPVEIAEVLGITETEATDRLLAAEQTFTRRFGTVVDGTPLCQGGL